MAFDPLAIFTGGPLAEAGANTRDAIAAMGTKVGNLAGAAGAGGIAALQSGQAGALGALGEGYGTAREDVLSMLSPAQRALYGGQTTAAQALAGSVDPAMRALYGGVAGAQAAYNPLMTAARQYGSFGTPSAQMIADANGLNGPEGVARAQAAYKASPGYDWLVNQGVSGAVRGANVAGGALGGNTLDAVTRLSQNLANQDYGSWLKRLQDTAALYSPLQEQALATGGAGRATAALTGGTGGANIISDTGKGLAGLYSTTGTNAANLYTDVGKTLGNIDVGGGTGAASIYGTTGQNIAQLLSGLAGKQIDFTQATINPTAQSFTNEGLASMLGSQNLWNLGGDIATFGTKKLAANAASPFGNFFNAPTGPAAGSYSGVGGWA